MSAQDWLTDTRVSYDTVADSYSDITREALAGTPLLRGVLALFARRRGRSAGRWSTSGAAPG